MLKLTLHDGRVVALNWNKIVHIIVTQDDESGAEYSRILLEGEQNVDVVESLEDVTKAIAALK